MLKPDIKALLHEGTVIPAHPLALHEDRTLDTDGQRALTRYYLDAGAGGIAVGVHTTQFEIREHRLYERVLQLAAEEVQTHGKTGPFIKVAGVSGPISQAVKEAEIARRLGYDLVLLSMGGLNDLSEEELLERTKKVADIMPVFGFYLQTAVGGRTLSFDFWKAFCEIDNVHAVKMAPFNRYQTLDVVRAVCESSRRDEIALYTGNDDNIVIDLLTTYRFPVGYEVVTKEIVGGLLGHWAVWTKEAVDLFQRIQAAKKSGIIDSEWLTIAAEVTDINAALFDTQNQFKGCIAGINEVLAQQGLLKGSWCLSDHEKLSPGQREEIERVKKAYPHLCNDRFVEENAATWRQELHSK
ncbi:dihydrodipicolinate synthase family protein [Pseudalkalibacillus sp. SCS-8]|uniref:dihydrodipicolinate synthase family protein n=1 Tax=Pseudalkalibacillus nanhaiensis TaxID=3115291 RepID=UPI0032D9F3E7